MSGHLEITRDFYNAFKSPNGEARALDLLADDAVFMTTGPAVSGKQNVFVALRDQDNGLIRHIVWSEPTTVSVAVQIVGEAPADQAKLGYIITLTFRDDKIALIKQQDIRDKRMAGAVRARQSESGIKIPDELKGMIKDARNKNPMLVACVDPTGQPVISYRGSLHAHSDDQLAMWIRNPEGELLTCIARNPKLALMFREQQRKTTFQFQGRARVIQDEAARARIYAESNPAEQAHDFARIGVGVIIDIDLLEGYFNLEPGWTMISQKRNS